MSCLNVHYTVTEIVRINRPSWDNEMKEKKCVNAEVNYTLNESRVIQRMLQYVYRKHSKQRLLAQKRCKLPGSCPVIKNKTNCDLYRSKTHLLYSEPSVSRKHSSVGIVAHYGLDGPGIVSRWGRDFLHHPDRSCGPPGLLHNGYRVSIQRIERPRCGVGHPPYLQPRLKNE